MAPADYHLDSISSRKMNDKRTKVVEHILALACGDMLLPRLDGKQDIFPGITAKAEVGAGSDKVRLLTLQYGKDVLLRLLDFRNQTTFRLLSIDAHVGLTDARLDPFLEKIEKSFKTADGIMRRRRNEEIRRLTDGIGDLVSDFLNAEMKSAPDAQAPDAPKQIEDVRYRVTDERENITRLPDGL